jgi:hypothetical protein
MLIAEGVCLLFPLLPNSTTTVCVVPQTAASFIFCWCTQDSKYERINFSVDNNIEDYSVNFLVFYIEISRIICS